MMTLKTRWAEEAMCDLPLPEYPRPQMVREDWVNLNGMFDFAITGKPCFLFATDVSDYIKDRNFYFPLQSLPFPVAYSNPELLQQVERFNEQEYFGKRKNFFTRLAFREDGKASQRCAQWILEKLQ